MGSASAPQLHFGDESGFSVCWLPIYCVLLAPLGLEDKYRNISDFSPQGIEAPLSQAAVWCSGLGTTPTGWKQLTCLLFFNFFFLCQVETQNFSCFPAVSKSFGDRNTIAATLPSMKHSQDALQCNTAVQQTRWNGTRTCSQFMGLIPMMLFSIKTKPSIFLLQTGCSNFHLRDSNAYMLKCGITESLGLTVKPGVLKLFF